jgi:hypothetical protein
VRLIGAVSSAAGQVLRAATRVVAVRPASKPLHPEGSVVPGTLVRHGTRPPSGVPWLDATGADEVVVRLSRALGLPGGLPDVWGLAVRVLGPGGAAGGTGDLLLASTGRGPWTRFLLTAHRSPRGTFGSLLPYRTSAGPVVMSAVHRDDTTLELAWAVGRGPWRPFADLRLRPSPAAEPDQPISFDPVLNTLSGLETYDWVRRMREPSYRSARAHR